MASFPGKLKGLFSGGGGRSEYTPVQLEEATESRVSLSTRQARGWYTDNSEPNADVDAGVNVGLLNHEAGDNGAEEKAEWIKKDKKRSCCGINYSKFFGIVAFLASIVGGYKLLEWAFYEPPVLIKGLPEFGTSLGCQASPYFYNNTKILTLNAPMHPSSLDHGVDFRGGAIGTIVLTSASTDSPNVQYEITIRSNDQDFAQESLIKLPEQDEMGHMFESMVTITTPYPPRENPELCVRYDAKIIVPSSLKKLHIGSHTLSHIKFDKNANINLDALFVTLFTPDEENIIQSSTSVKATKMSLELTRGWLTGDVSILDETRLVTQRGDGVLHVDVFPEPPKDENNSAVMTFDTTTGAGSTKVFVHPNKGAKRPITATHISSQNGPMEFTYKGAGISGLVGLEAKELHEEGLEKLDQADLQEDGQWNYYVGSKEGKDRISVNSRGWVELHF